MFYPLSNIAYFLEMLCSVAFQSVDRINGEEIIERSFVGTDSASSRQMKPLAMFEPGLCVLVMRSVDVGRQSRYEQSCSGVSPPTLYSV